MRKKPLMVLHSGKNHCQPLGDAAVLKSLMVLCPGAYVIKILFVWLNGAVPACQVVIFQVAFLFEGQ